VERQRAKNETYVPRQGASVRVACLDLSAFPLRLCCGRSRQKPDASIGPDDWPVMNCWTIGSGEARSASGVARAWTVPW